MVVIKDIKIPDTNYIILDRENEDTKKDHVLMNLSKVNIFIGENNSGKSRLIRSFILNDSLSFTSEDLYRYNKTVNNLKKNLLRPLEEHNWRGTNAFQSIYDRLFKLNTVDFISNDNNNNNEMENLTNFKDFLEKLPNGGLDVPMVQNRVVTLLSDEFDKNLDFNEPIDEINFIYSFKRIYIPVLRGLRSHGDPDIYWNRTVSDYFRDSNKSIPSEDDLKKRGIEIFTGLKSYEIVKKHLLGNLKERKLIEDYQNYLKQFFDNKEVALIPNEAEKCLK